MTSAKRWAIAALITIAPATAHAEMTVGTFVSKADALKAKGVLALGSADIGLLRKEMGTVTLAYREDIKGARAAGRTPHSCPPPKSSMNSDDMIAHFRTLAPSTGIKSGFYSLMKKKYPCPTK